MSRALLLESVAMASNASRGENSRRRIPSVYAVVHRDPGSCY